MSKRDNKIFSLDPATCKGIHNRQMYVDHSFNQVKIDLSQKRGKFLGILVGRVEDNSCEGQNYVDH